jgi:hypothetical protein
MQADSFNPIPIKEGGIGHPIKFTPGMFRELLAYLLLLHQIGVTDVIQYSKTITLFSLSK